MNQQQHSSSKKTFIIMLIIIVIAALIYFYTMGNPTDNSSLLQSSNPDSEDAQNVGSRVLVLLNQINSLRIDASVFTTATYKSLVDYTIAVPEQPVGRDNPFAPLPGSQSARTSPAGR